MAAGYPTMGNKEIQQPQIGEGVGIRRVMRMDVNIQSSRVRVVSSSVVVSPRFKLELPTTGFACTSKQADLYLSSVSPDLSMDSSGVSGVSDFPATFLMSS
jgi:hypothetical protein